jgi:hypothetical protein
MKILCALFVIPFLVSCSSEYKSGVITGGSKEEMYASFCRLLSGMDDDDRERVLWDYAKVENYYLNPDYIINDYRGDEYGIDQINGLTVRDIISKAQFVDAEITEYSRKVFYYVYENRDAILRGEMPDEPPADWMITENPEAEAEYLKYTKTRTTRP